MMNITNRTKRNTILFIIATLLLIALLPIRQSMVVNADDREPSSRILCRYEAGKVLANLQSTDYFYYLTRSKSASTSMDRVNSTWLNKVLTVAGYDFVTPNEAILGREIRPSSVPEESTEEANENAPKVSAFDRFGVAGLKWSSYQGEWKYNQVDVCARQGQISPTTYGSFYDKRLEPQSTYNEVSTSKDPRTIQFDKGLMSNIATAFSDTIANGLFSIAKLVVTLTIVFVGLAFTDITSLLGLAADGTGGLTAAGVFSDLFNTIFSGFVVIAFILTAIYMLYNVVFKRQMRLAISTIIKTILIFMIAVIMSTNPSYWVGVPNKIATYGQALVLNSMAGIYDNIEEGDNPKLCTTEVASVYENVNLSDLDEDNLMTEFEKVNVNMRSIIGCKMWEELLFKPWVKGQFGTDYENLNADVLGNINETWVGTGSVPIGNGQTIDNWALFHLSTQTDAHAQIGNNNFPTIVNDVNADWWRIVDALSNYDEGETTETIGGEEHTHMLQVPSDPSEYWQSWIGNNSVERIGTAFIAIAFGIVGSLAPLVFSLSSAVLGFGITLLMMTAPLFLLFGTWGGKGDGIFLGWLSALANTMIKRIAVSILLVLSIAITLSIMNLIYIIGFVKSFILMIVVTLILIKNKNKILDMLANVDFGGTFNPRTKANQIMDSTNRKAKDVGKIGLATAAGAYAGARSGQGIRRGAGIGARSQLRNTLYQSQFGMNIVRELDINLEKESQAEHTCIMCRIKLGSKIEKVTAYRDDEGNYYCISCADELGIETLYEVLVGLDGSKNTDTQLNDIPEYIPESKTRTEIATNRLSYLRHADVIKQMDARIIEDRYYWNNDSVKKMIYKNIEDLRKDIIVFSNTALELGKQAAPPALPQPLHEYVDIALLNQAWTYGEMDTVENTYKEAWKAWYEDNARLSEGIVQEEIDKFKKEIENFKPDISEDEVDEILEDLYEHTDELEERKNRDLYIYKEGKLVFNKYLDRDK